MHTPETGPLEQAFLRSSVAAARYDIAALKARAEGRGQAARLFAALAEARRVHAAKALMLLRGRAEDTETALETARRETDAEAQALKANLQAMDESPEAGFLDQFRKTALIHASLLKTVSEDAPAPYHVCTVCGFIFRDSVRGRCPVCGAVHSRFHEVR